jgi:hypothetical protein
VFHHVELRLERLDTKLDAKEKHLASLATGMESRLSSVGNHLDGKTGNYVVVGLWGATLAMLIAAASALTKLV